MDSRRDEFFIVLDAENIMYAAKVASKAVSTPHSPANLV